MACYSCLGSVSEIQWHATVVLANLSLRYSGVLLDLKSATSVQTAPDRCPFSQWLYNISWVQRPFAFVLEYTERDDTEESNSVGKVCAQHWKTEKSWNLKQKFARSEKVRQFVFQKSCRKLKI